MNESGRDYTCIGFSRSHGLFDGGGAAMVMDALIAEINGKEWTVPPLPLEYPSVNSNPIKECVEEEVRMQEYRNDYSGVAVLGVNGVLKLAAWHARERWWRGAQRRIILLSKTALESLVGHVRSNIRKWRESAEGISTGDVLVAWLLKVRFSLSGTITSSLPNENTRQYTQLEHHQKLS